MYIPTRAQDRGPVARALLDAAAELGLHERVVRSVFGGFQVPDEVGHHLGIPRNIPDAEVAGVADSATGPAIGDVQAGHAVEPDPTPHPDGEESPADVDPAVLEQDAAPPAESPDAPPADAPPAGELEPESGADASPPTTGEARRGSAPKRGRTRRA